MKSYLYPVIILFLLFILFFSSYAVFNRNTSSYIPEQQFGKLDSSDGLHPNIHREPDKKTAGNIKQNENLQDELEKLRSLPYIQWSEKKIDSNSGKGVVKFDRSKAFFGYNLYSSDDTKHAFLMDMEGKIVHSWEFKEKGWWSYSTLLDDGQIIAICIGQRIVKLDAESNIIWRTNLGVHHDIEILPDGSVLVPVKNYYKYNSMNVMFDHIALLSDKGKFIKEWSTWKHLEKLQKLHPPTALDMPGVKNKIKGGARSEEYHYYHLNSVQSLKETALGKKDKRFQKGNILVCLRNVSLICILDKDTEDIVWSWGVGVLDWPHMPRMLENGNILIFDNGTHRSYSRIIEIDPVSEKIVWQYRGTKSEPFYTEFRGSSQRLPNGNTLICESDNGRVFEVTREGEIVWEFLNPEIQYGKRKRIYRLLRIVDPEKYAPLLKEK